MNENGEIVKKSFHHIPYKYVRVGKKDDKNYNGKYAIFSNWDNTNDKKEIIYVDAYNPEYVLEQVKKCDGKTLEEQFYNYKGQLYFFNYSSYTYP